MIVENRGEVVGYLTDAIPDMWYLEGNFEVAPTAAGARFLASALSIDPKAAFKDSKKAIRTHLRETPDDKGCVFLVMSLSEGHLFGRRVYDSVAVALALAEIPE